MFDVVFLNRLRQQIFLIGLGLLLIASAFILSSAQDDPKKKERPRRALPVESEPQDIIKIDSDLVPVDVIVTDAKGRPARNLRKEDFKLFEDGIERPIAAFNLEKIEGAPRPAAIVFALDLSGSMSPDEVDRVASAMREFSRQLAEHPAVFAVMTFGMRVIAINWSAPSTVWPTSLMDCPHTHTTRLTTRYACWSVTRR